ncbi:MAG: DUF402 domain-containing protein [Cytobacillus gottheilii]|uniref:DUF402 domain-containing protein n=1 Tax=Cytobacillus gottheilii TaxID=859144 RepID=UPI00346482C3
MDKIIERKIKYDSKIVDYHCKLLYMGKQSAVLFHINEESFTMTTNQKSLTIPKGSYTIAYYWEDRAYNLYFWRDQKGNYLGAYFNIVKNTTINAEMVSFEDLIIDILVLPNGKYFVLDENELPEALDQFENGFVKQALFELTGALDVIFLEVKSEANGIYRHERFIPILENSCER